MFDDRHVVLVSRKWTDQTIAVDVDVTGIEIRMGLNGFLDAVAKTIGNPLLLVTQSQLRKQLQVAAERVVQDMKDETGRVM